MSKKETITLNFVNEETGEEEFAMDLPMRDFFLLARNAEEKGMEVEELIRQIVIERATAVIESAENSEE